MSKAPQVVNLAVLRTLVSELTSREDEFGTIELTRAGIMLTLRFGCNGHAIEERKLISWDVLHGLTVNGAQHLVRELRFALEAEDDRD